MVSNNLYELQKINKDVYDQMAKCFINKNKHFDKTIWCHDRKQVLFGSRVSVAETNPIVSGSKLLKDMVRIFPTLRQRKISY